MARGATMGDAHDSLTAARALPEAEWRPIATAPRDGTRVLLWSRYGIRIGDWNRGSGWLSLNYGQPSHWMPLPVSPTVDADVEHYDQATVRHLKEREREYLRTLWALASAAWPQPLRVQKVARDAWTYRSELQMRIDHQTDELLIYAPPPMR